MAETISNTRRHERFVVVCFCAFLLIVLNVLIDPRAMDVTLIPRLLALQVFLLVCVVVTGLSRLSARIDFSVLRDPLVVCTAAYSLVTTVSLFYAVNPSAGFTEASKNWALLITICLACLLLPVHSNWPMLVVKCGIVAAVLGVSVGVYDWTRHLGWGFHPRQEMLAVTGLMSNVNLYASFLLFMFPLCLGGIFLLRGPWQWTACVVVGVLILLIVGLQTRATYLGLLASFAVLAAILLSRKQGAQSLKRKQAVTAIVIAAILVVAASLVVLSAPGFWHVVDRLQSTFKDQSLTAAGGRPVIWLASISMILDHFLFGVGAGNFPVYLHNYFDVDDPDFSMVHPNWLQPHNDFIWVWAEKGLIGFVLYLSIFFIASYHLFEALRYRSVDNRTSLAPFVAMGLAGYLTVAFFDFPMERVNHQVYLAFYLAMTILLGRTIRHKNGPPANPLDDKTVWLFSSLAIILLVAGIFYTSMALRQERYILQARLSLSDLDYEGAVNHAQLAATPLKTLDPFATPVSFLEGLSLVFLARFDEAIPRLEQARREMPSRTYIINALALAHRLAGRHDKAISLYEEVLRRSPDYLNTHHSIAIVHLRAGRPQEAIRALERVPPEQQTDEMKATLERAQRRMEKR